jgi:hypothetical protein
MFPATMPWPMTHHGFPSVLVVSLAHEDLHLSLALDVTMSLSVPGRAVPPHLATMTALPGVVSPVAPLLSLLMWQYGTIPLVIPPVIALQMVAPPPAA